MAQVRNAEYKVLDVKEEHLFTFSEGIPGFEKVKRFLILTKPEEAPFGRLVAVDFDLCFFVIDPWTVCQDYKPDIGDEEIKKIGSPSHAELLILAIVTIPGSNPQESTMNLAAPVIINVKEGVGRQVIINNYRDYSSKFKLWKQPQG